MKFSMNFVICAAVLTGAIAAPCHLQARDDARESNEYGVHPHAQSNECCGQPSFGQPPNFSGSLGMKVQVHGMPDPAVAVTSPSHPQSYVQRRSHEDGRLYARQNDDDDELRQDHKDATAQVNFHHKGYLDAKAEGDVHGMAYHDASKQVYMFAAKGHKAAMKGNHELAAEHYAASHTHTDIANELAPHSHAQLNGKIAEANADILVHKAAYRAAQRNGDQGKMNFHQASRKASKSLVRALMAEHRKDISLARTHYESWRSHSKQAQEHFRELMPPSAQRTG